MTTRPLGRNGPQVSGVRVRDESGDRSLTTRAVVLATGVAFLSEYKSDREFEALNAHKEALRVKVLRDAAFHTVGLEEVVVGDLV